MSGRVLTVRQSSSRRVGASERRGWTGWSLGSGRRERVDIGVRSSWGREEVSWRQEQVNAVGEGSESRIRTEHGRERAAIAVGSGRASRSRVGRYRSRGGRGVGVRGRPGPAGQGRGEAEVERGGKSRRWRGGGRWWVAARVGRRGVGERTMDGRCEPPHPLVSGGVGFWTGGGGWGSPCTGPWERKLYNISRCTVPND